ncbi:substrate-binding domain-containing protein [Treponema parvum]|uniref:Substrate-binding domain-containing protein n=1 Tax=Treponema parvum TaxID=138851 RepID=A0A975IE58_9SPIR|nr:substrate-binding domain-containing protein [Treponema parvum]QTQ13606.1 substrate-binding domain-containing protein [Treponema parvum]
MKKTLFAVLALTLAIGTAFAKGGEEKVKKTSGFKIAESTCFLTPTWQKLTLQWAEKQFAKYKGDGTVAGEYRVVDAAGDTNQQINDIRNLVKQGYDAIILIANDAEALNDVIEEAEEQGVRIINIDSLVTSKDVTSKIGTDGLDFGATVAQWVVNQIGGKGNVIVCNGPQGVSVSEDRRKGALNVLAKYPGIKIVAETYSDYNEGPAIDAIRPVLDANPNIDGIITLGGSQGSAALKTLQAMGRKLVPIGSENYGAYLKNWQKLRKQGFSSMCVGQPNWLGALGVEQAVRALKGQKIKKEVILPISSTVIDDAMIEKLDLSGLADDGYLFTITDEQINELLK